MKFRTVIFALLVLVSPALSWSAPQPPSVTLGALYSAVEMASVFPDQKTFADAIAREHPQTITSDYAREKDEPSFSLQAFVAKNFRLPQRKSPKIAQRSDQDVRAYIREMWTVLRRAPDDTEANSSLLPLAHPYIVPGGRFSEIYYWDSYFTMQGLMQDGQYDLARNMLANIASLITRYGHMPNGNRSYYLSRSQPPFFAAMVELVAAHDGDDIYREYLPQMQAEYDYWMEGAQALSPGAAHRHAVRLRDGTLLNRYWDDRATPRDESWRQDVQTARQSNRPAASVYRDLRAGAESGWDYSSRWLTDSHRLATIRTTHIVPVDLNSLMQHLEQTLAKTYAVSGDTAKARLYASKAQARTTAIRRLMWNGRAGLYGDYLWEEERQSPELTAATVYPLYFGIATATQTHAIAEALRRDFLMPGGLATTRQTTGQQWDRPNGWAPLQYMAVEGLKRYDEKALAAEIAERWIHRNIESYAATGVLQEKYDIEAPQIRAASGGEYALQIGFGWTNGVLARLMTDYPSAR
ncbi:MAG TPA: alpha,alpha-trehalase TreF [Rhizomicrobium sp.]|jgi:alpha,alpha-trehalase